MRGLTVSRFIILVAGIDRGQAPELSAGYLIKKIDHLVSWPSIESLRSGREEVVFTFLKSNSGN
jgi:hypothetical protein